MSTLDTNVLVRYLVGDVPKQAEAARELIEGLTADDPGFICREVVLEVAWVLERTYRFMRSQVAEALMDLTASDSLVVENSDDVAAAAYRYRRRGLVFRPAVSNAGIEHQQHQTLHPPGLRWSQTPWLRSSSLGQSSLSRSSCETVP